MASLKGRIASNRPNISYIQWSLHGLALFVYLVLFSQYLSNLGTERITWPDNIYAGFPTQKSEQTLGSAEPSVYQGRPTPQLEKAWDELLNVGIVGINSAESSRLSFSTAKNIYHPDEYVIELNVFHQLHCLRMLRELIWTPKQIAWSNGEEVGWWEFHMDHCAEHLRLSLMCMADVTPQRFLWDYNARKYTLPQKQHFMCKDFDAISAWAKDRNTTGLSPQLATGRDDSNSVLDPIG